MDASKRDTFPDEDTPLGPFLGNLPSDVLRVLLGHLTPFERALFARAGGACYRAAKQSGLGRAGVSSHDIEQLVKRDELTASMSVFAWSLNNLGDPDQTVKYVVQYDVRYCFDVRLGTLVVESAAGADSPDFLVYLRDMSTGEDAKPFPWKDKKTCAAAARNGRLESIKWLRANDCPWDEETCDRAAQGKHLDVVKWLRDNGCPWSARACGLVAMDGDLDMLKWLRANDCPWDWTTGAKAAKNGDMDTLKWAHANGCPWSTMTCAFPAYEGHLDVLRWLRANGCPWDEQTCSFAAEGGQLDVLRWARENGCPWDERTWQSACAGKHLDVLMWLVDNDGFPGESADDDD